MKKQNKLFLVTFVITTSVLTIFLAIIKIINEGEKIINEKGVSVCFASNNLYVRHGEKQYTIEPDKQAIAEAVNYVFEHPIILPPPFSFMLFSNGLVESCLNFLKI